MSVEAGVRLRGARSGGLGWYLARRSAIGKCYVRLLCCIGCVCVCGKGRCGVESVSGDGAGPLDIVQRGDL